MIIMDEKMVGIWFLATTRTQDWMCAVREIEPDTRYEITYRFRYHKDHKVFESEDEKHWFKAEVTGTRIYAIGSIRMVAKELEKASGIDKLYELINDGDFEKFWKEFQKAPFVFQRQASKEEIAEMEKEAQAR